MYNYKIGYSWEEGSGYVELYHSQKFSKKQLKEIIVDASLKVLIDKRKESHWLNWFEEGDSNDDDGLYNIYSSFNDILDQVIEILIKEYGFGKIEYEQIIELPGLTGIVSPENDYKSDFSYYDIEIFEEIRKKYWERKGQKGE